MKTQVENIKVRLANGQVNMAAALRLGFAGSWIAF
jgi:hypothetical protein